MLLMCSKYCVESSTNVCSSIESTVKTVKSGGCSFYLSKPVWFGRFPAQTRFNMPVDIKDCIKLHQLQLYIYLLQL